MMPSSLLLLITIFSQTLRSGQSVAWHQPSCEAVVPQQGRDQPQYTGLSGYLFTGRYRDPPGYYKQVPDNPTSIALPKQVGPTTWAPGPEKRPTRLPVVVIGQSLTHERFGRYTGLLTVQTADGKETFKIDVDNFTPAPYWQCAPDVAIKHAPFVARVKPGARLVSQDGRWLELGAERRVYCRSQGRRQDVERGVGCLVYKRYQYGFGGVEHTIAARDLEILY
jgi:hypothetical protein